MNSNKIKKVTVCIGGRFIENKNIDINALYKSEPNNKLFSDIFSAEEKMEITSSDIDFLPMEIHLDDTIETIKKKCGKSLTHQLVTCRTVMSQTSDSLSFS